MALLSFVEVNIAVNIAATTDWQTTLQVDHNAPLANVICEPKQAIE